MKARSGALHHSWLDTGIILLLFSLFAAAFYIPVVEPNTSTKHHGVAVRNFEASVYRGVKVDFVVVRLADGRTGTIRGFAEPGRPVCIETSDGAMSGQTRIKSLLPIEDCDVEFARN